MELLQLDPREQTLLKLYALMKDTPTAYQLGFQLAAYHQVVHRADPFRFLKCLDLLSLSAESLVAILFRPSIGNASMSRLIADIISPKKIVDPMPMFPLNFKPFPVGLVRTDGLMPTDEFLDRRSSHAEPVVNPISPDEEEADTDVKPFPLLSMVSVGEPLEESVTLDEESSDEGEHNEESIQV
uniref:Symplekin_C domain-containing protein n=1 Tax=Heterorhabditis bacteriophora TaxID=37862 RepID=A0A1I7XIE5_HETBA